MKELAILFLVFNATFTMKAQILEGSHWTARKFDDVYIVSVQDKASISEALTDFAVSQKIQGGEVTGIGAVNEATLRFFDPATKKYVDKVFNEQMEISNLSGNIAIEEGKTFLHLHITLGRRDYTTLAGHLLDARTRGAGEFFIRPVNAKMIKVKNNDIGLYFYDFGK
jgi:predicted DNA-binding protein with PD1-like motif